MLDEPEVDAIRDLAVAAATEAADLLVRGRRGTVTVAATKSSDTDVVTELDRASEAVLVRRIIASRPDDGLLGEEGSDRVGTSGLRWVLDPLDGTVNYLYGLGSWAVSVAVQDELGTLVGVVAAPTLGETYVAVRGRGAHVVGDDGVRVRLRVNDPVRLERALVGTGFGYRRERRELQAAVVAQLLPEIRDIRRAGACATDLCHLGAGRLDGFYEVGPQPWDHAAGGLVAQEAGARFALLPLPGQDDPLILAAGPTLFGPLRDRLLAAHARSGG